MLLRHVINEVIWRAVYKRQNMHKKILTMQIYFKPLKTVTRKPAFFWSAWPLCFWSFYLLLPSSSLGSIIFRNNSSCFPYYYLHNSIQFLLKNDEKLKYSGIPENPNVYQHCTVFMVLFFIWKIWQVKW